ncbi:hypothetical protein PC114_g17126 [Phytophthora cactorum]|nr:hypothetical protein PC112_g23418 [Phytophthora cactorum]KAG2891139.1 hypothetical protein PC114_g17126 [Phytophthora cactorum]
MCRRRPVLCLRPPRPSFVQQRANESRFCSTKCVRKFFNEENVGSEELTPSSSLGVSISSQATVIDLAQGDEQFGNKHKVVNRVPEEIAHTPPANTRGTSHFVGQATLATPRHT